MTDVSSTVVHGDCIPGFEPLRQLFASNLTTGVDLGASVSVTINGEFAVDLWGGWSDVARTRPWTEDTLTLVYSTTKMMAALSALILVDGGARPGRSSCKILARVCSTRKRRRAGAPCSVSHIRRL